MNIWASIQSFKRKLTPKRTKDDLFKPQFALLDKQRDHFSASGKYRLVITPYSTGKGTWNYTQGTVYRVATGDRIAVVRRNYSAFPFLFVEEHPNGHPYLICGEDYQGQTVIELDTRRRRDFRPEAANQGVGFCWSSYQFHAPTQTLMVDGCYWGGPYEYKFYDFSNPMEGWPYIDTGCSIDSDEKKPSFEPDGTVKCYETRDPYEDDEREEDTPVDGREVVAIITLRRQDGKLVKADEWVSAKERTRRAEHEEGLRKHAEHWKAYEATDPMYRLANELRNNPVFDDAKLRSGGRGWCYQGWCPHWSGEEARMCFDLVSRYRDTKHSKPRIELEWAVKTGPIKIVVTHQRWWEKKAKQTTTWFEHSEDGMRKAFTHAMEQARG